MRTLITIILLIFFGTPILGQTKQPVYVGKASWRKEHTQKKPDPLVYEVSSYPIQKVSYTDSLDTIFSRKVDPGTVTLKTGPTLPVTEPLKITAKKLEAPQVFEAPPLQIRDNAQFNVHYTDKKHGFPALAAYDFAEDEEHNIWIATERGVISYDGYYYHYYKQSNIVTELGESSILYDYQKRLWVASSNGLYYIKNDSIHYIQHSEIDFSNLDCKEVIIDQFQRIWIPTKSYGAICIDGNTVKVYDKRCGLPNNFVEAMYVDKKGNLLMASREHGIVIIEPDKMRMFFSKTKNILFHNFLAFYEDQDGVWASCYTASLFKLSPTDTLQYSFTGRFNEVILDMKKAPKGIWISCYGKGIFYMSGKNILKINETNGLLNNVPMRIFVDRFENVWVSNIEGLSRINDNSFHLNRFTNSAISHTNEIIPDKNKKGDWLITFARSILFRRGNTVTAYQYKSPIHGSRFNYLYGGALNKDGSLWVGAYAEGIVHATEHKYTLYKYSDFTDNLVMLSIKQDAANNVWFCPNRFGLIMHNQDRFWHYTQKSGLLSNNPVNLFLDAEKVVSWTFTQGGLQRFKNESIETFYINNQPFTGKINKVIQLDQKKALWGTDNYGLLLHDGEQVFQFTKTNGLQSNSIITLIKDQFGKIWISTDKGIESFNIQGHTIENHSIFNKADGNYILDAKEVFLDTTGLPYWVIGNKKLVFNPELMHSKKNTPILNFKEILINTKPLQTNNIIILPDEKITLSYRTIYWGKESNLELSYLLISNQKDTTERPIQNTDKILISDILPGQYKVVLKAVDNNKTYYSSQINITVNDFWYNTWLFRITVGAFILASIIFYFRRKSLRQLRINEELQRKVQEQTKEIEKEKEALLVSYQTIAIQNKEKDVLIDEINHRVKNNLQFIAAILEMQVGKQYSKEAIEALLGTSRRIKAMSLIHELLYNKKDATIELPIKSYIYELVDNLKEIADTNIQPAQIDLNIDSIIIDSKKALSIGMIVSELVSNSYKHAFNNILKPKIWISLKKDSFNKTIILKIEDNGNGYQPSIQKDSGLGMRLVDIFSRQLEGTYELNTEGIFSYTLYINDNGDETY